MKNKTNTSHPQSVLVLNLFLVIKDLSIYGISFHLFFDVYSS